MKSIFRDIKDLYKEYKKIPLIRVSIIVSVIIMLVFAILFGVHRSFTWTAAINSNLFSDYGGLMSGVLGTFLAFISIVLLYEALKVSQDQLKIQRKSLKQQEVEAHFFELLKIHNENSRTIRTDDPQFFQDSIDILDAIYEHLKKILSVNNFDDKKTQILIAITYLLYYYGSSSRDMKTVEVVMQKFCKKNNFNLNLNEMNIVTSLKDFNSEFTMPGFAKLKDDTKHGIFFRVYGTGKTSGSGFSQTIYCHVSKERLLGTYFRHLYQTVKYINEQPEDIISFEKKYEYVKTLRAQLSSFEQLLLFWDSLSPLGYAWEMNEKIGGSKSRDADKMLITKYKLIKNIPAEYENKDITPQTFYPDMEFDWLKTK